MTEEIKSRDPFAELPPNERVGVYWLLAAAAAIIAGMVIVKQYVSVEDVLLFLDKIGRAFRLLARS